MGEWYIDPKTSRPYFLGTPNESVTTPPDLGAGFKIRSLERGEIVVNKVNLLNINGNMGTYSIVTRTSPPTNTLPIKNWPEPTTYETLLKTYAKNFNENGGMVSFKEAELYKHDSKIILKSQQHVSIYWSPNKVSFSWPPGLQDLHTVLSQYLGSSFKLSLVENVWGFIFDHRPWTPVVNEMEINLTEDILICDVWPLQQMDSINNYICNITPQDVAKAGLDGVYPQFIPTSCKNCLDLEKSHLAEHVAMNDLSFFLMYAAASEFLPYAHQCVWNMIYQCREGKNEKLKDFLRFYRAFFLSSLSNYLVLSLPNYGEERLGWAKAKKKSKLEWATGTIAPTPIPAAIQGLGLNEIDYAEVEAINAELDLEGAEHVTYETNPVGIFND